MLTLSSDALVLYQEAAAVLLRPLAYPDLDAWRDDVCEVVRAFVGGDAVMAGVPGRGSYLHSPHLSESTLAGIKRFLEGPSLGSEPSPDPRVNVFYRELQQRRLDTVDFADVDRITGGGLYESAAYQEVFGPAGLRDMRTLYVSTRAEDRSALASLAVYASRAVPRAEGARRLWRLRLLRPALEAALDMLARARATCVAFDAAERPFAVFTKDGRLLHRTPTLDRLLADDPHRVRLEAAIAVLVRRAGVPTRGACTSHVESPSHREVVTLNRRYVLDAIALSEGPFGSESNVLVRVEHEVGTALPGVEEVRARFGLTRRQAEVALLLAEGGSNAQIAERLSISPHTARRHTEGVMGALFVEHRAAVASRLLGLA